MPFVDLTDVRCYYELRGQGEPLLLIPGLGNTCRQWDPIAADLAKHFCLISVDNRGVGQSVARRHPTTLRDYTADLVELLDHLQVARTHVMGLSLGGVIAQRFAIDHPDQASRLVLISCANHFGPFLRQVATMVGQSLHRFSPKLFAQSMQVLGGGPLYFDADPQRIERELEKATQTAAPRAAMIRQLRCLAASDPDPDEYHISAPTLVISGEHDSLIPHCYARKMAQAIPGSRYMLVPEAGHNPFNECPDQVLPAIIEFLHASETAKAEPQEHDQESGPHRDAA